MTTISLARFAELALFGGCQLREWTPERTSWDDLHKTAQKDCHQADLLATSDVKSCQYANWKKENVEIGDEVNRSRHKISDVTLRTEGNV